jgi:hypothetical protein
LLRRDPETKRKPKCTLAGHRLEKRQARRGAGGRHRQYTDFPSAVEAFASPSLVPIGGVA